MAIDDTAQMAAVVYIANGHFQITHLRLRRLVAVVPTAAELATNVHKATADDQMLTAVV